MRVEGEDSKQTADALTESGRIDDTYSAYRDLADQFPDDPRGIAGMADTVRRLGRPEEALSIYREMAGRFPDDPVALAGVAETLRELGDLEEALDAYREMEKQLPENPVAMAGVADTLRELGRFEEALNAYREMRDRFPGNPRAMVGMAETLRMSGRPDDALTIYRDVIERFGQDPVAMAGMADALRGVGRPEEALSLYQEMRDWFPDDPRGAAGMAETYRELGRVDEALAIYREMASRFPDDPRGIAGMAETARELGGVDEALAIYREMASRFPDDPRGTAGAAGILRELGRSEEAIAFERETGKKPSETTQAPGAQTAAEPDGQAAQKHSTAPFYSDHPARRDTLKRKAVAETIATMIENVWNEDAKEGDVDRTFIVHLHGRWGAGKTSILNFLKEALQSQDSKEILGKEGYAKKPDGPPWVIVDFNAWQYQKLGPAWWTLMENVYRQAYAQFGGFWRRKGFVLAFKNRWWRIRSSYMPYATAAGILTLTISLLFFLWGQSFGEGVKVVGTVVGIIVAIFAFGHNYRIGSARTAKSYMELSRDPLSPLIKRYEELVRDIDRPVAVFVDDLDRCDADYVVELLQTIQTMFRNARVLYVVAADRDWICASYQQRYQSFRDVLDEPGKSLGHLFLEKIFQLSIEVPRLGENECSSYWQGLINSQAPEKTAETKEIADQVSKEFESAQTESEIVTLVERYRSDPVRSNVAANRGFKRMQSATLVKAREHFLAEYAPLIEPNPRAMKRLLNAYGFRRGFDLLSGRRSDPDALVRWTILENRWPVLADHLEGRSGGGVDSAIIDELVKDGAVLEVAHGVTWEKLRPVGSAPDRPPPPGVKRGAVVKPWIRSA